MNALALVLALALSPAAPAAPTAVQAGSAAVAASTAPAAAASDAAALLKSSKTRLDASDSAGALADAEAAVAAGGGAAALAARADAKRALGRAPEQAIDDYAAAAKLDPAYEATYRRLLDQATTAKSGHPKAGGMGGIPIGLVGIVSLAGVFLLVGACFVMLRHQANPLRTEEPPPAEPPPGGKTP
jgi:hypothetical protein